MNNEAEKPSWKPREASEDHQKLFKFQALKMHSEAKLSYSEDLQKQKSFKS
jgi:hypothetical protein